MKIVPTLAPGWVINGNWPHLALLREDFAKAAKEAQTTRLEKIPTRYVVYPSVAEAREVLGQKDERPVFLDIETASIEKNAEIVCCGVAREPGHVVCLPWHEPFKQMLKYVLLGDKTLKVAHNAAFDFPRLARSLGLGELAGPWYDTMVAFHLCQPDLEKGLYMLGSLWYDQHPWKGDKNDTLELYNCKDVDATARAFQALNEWMEELGLTRLFWDREMPRLKRAMRMSARGLRVDLQSMGVIREQVAKLVEAKQRELGECIARIPARANKAAALRAEAEELERAAAEADGTRGKREGNKLRTQARHRRRAADEVETLNVNSPKQLIELFYQDLGLPVKSKRRKNKGKVSVSVSTDEAAMLELNRKNPHPIFPLIMDLREGMKNVGTYLSWEEEMVYPQWNTAGTGTGRWSSSDPNMQNIPKKGEWAKLIRRCFIPRHPGWMFTAADYSQIERRLQAILWNEPVLLEAYARNEDVHMAVTRLVWGKEAPSQEERDATKTLVYGESYGMGEIKMHQTLTAMGLELTFAEVKALMRKLKEATPRINAGREALLQQVERERMLRTVFGRIRWFLGPVHGAALNFPFQGMAADIVGDALVEISDEAERLGGFAVLQIHDEILVEHPPEVVRDVRAMMKRVMEQPIEELNGAVIPVEVKSGWNFAFDPRWAEEQTGA